MLYQLVARTTIARIPEFGEYVVRAYDQFGERMPECDYFTDCKDDANSTAKMMVMEWQENCNKYSL